MQYTLVRHAVVLELLGEGTLKKEMSLQEILEDGEVRSCSDYVWFHRQGTTEKEQSVLGGTQWRKPA